MARLANHPWLEIVGPLIAGSTLAYNAYTDARVDIFNPRKAHLAYVQGWLSPAVVLNLSRGLVFLGLALSLILGVEFLALMATCVLLSFLYSNPRTKLKSIAGGDLLVNMVGIGAIVPLAGWAATGSSISTRLNKRIVANMRQRLYGLQKR